MADLDTFAKRLRYVREIRGLSQKRLSELTSVMRSPGHVCQLENERIRMPNSATAAALAAVLGVSLDWLLTGVGTPPQEVA